MGEAAGWALRHGACAARLRSGVMVRAWKGRVSAPARNWRSLAAGAATAGGTSTPRVLHGAGSRAH